MIALRGCRRVASIIPTRAIPRPCRSEVLDLRTKNRSLLQCNDQKASFLSVHSRNMSSNSGVRNAYPQYSIIGPTHSMSIKVILPGYRLARREALVLDYSNKGRMLFEFTPRGSDGRLDYAQKVSMGLSAEEVGLLCNQLPHQEVEIVRNPNQTSNSAGGGESFEGTVTNDMPQKVMKFSPSDGSAVTCTLDLVSEIDGNSELESGRMEVIAQAGEFEVLASIMRSSLPVLAGWSPLVDIQVQAAIDRVVNDEGGFY